MTNKSEKFYKQSALNLIDCATWTRLSKSFDSFCQLMSPFKGRIIENVKIDEKGLATWPVKN